MWEDGVTWLGGTGRHIPRVAVTARASTAGLNSMGCWKEVERGEGWQRPVGGMGE